jgi:transcription antitermination factor NusG
MKHWYVVQVYAGYEEAAKADLLKSELTSKCLEDCFGQILIPAAKLRQFFEVDEQRTSSCFLVIF